MCEPPQSGRRQLFFFQAEDGIRDLTVTGVQTCALPIYAARGALDDLAHRREGVAPDVLRVVLDPSGSGIVLLELATSDRDCACRSEEHTSELQSQSNLVCRLLLEKKNKNVV